MTKSRESDQVDGETYSSLLKERSSATPRPSLPHSALRFQRRKVGWAETIETEDESLAILSRGESLLSPRGISSKNLSMVRQIDANVDSPSNQELNCALPLCRRSNLSPVSLTQAFASIPTGTYCWLVAKTRRCDSSASMGRGTRPN
jgi:hypothetical protein